MQFWVGAVKQAHATEHFTAASAEPAFDQVDFKTWQQILTVGRAVFTVLFELDQLRANDPVAQHQQAIDGRDGAGLGVLMNLSDSFDELPIFHGGILTAPFR